MRDHAMENEIWDEGQLGGVEGVLGTVDQLLIDVCIMEEVRSYHRNLAVAYYDYKKAYDKVHHDWMLRVFNWMGIPKNVTELLKALMVKWKTRLEVWNDGQKQVSRWIQIKSFKATVILQWDSALQRFRLANYSKHQKATKWEDQDKEI